MIEKSETDTAGAVDRIYRRVVRGFAGAGASTSAERRVGAELKFPLVKQDGAAADLETTRAVWNYLIERGWTANVDGMTGNVVGASKPGRRNDTVASVETGFCKHEFSLAHTGDLFELAESVRELREELRPFAEERRVHFLGYGIQPVTPPGKRLLMKQSRTSVWDKIFGANRVLPPEDGDDVNLFTVNAASHVHIGVSQEEAMAAVNVLNGFSGAQIALTADSSVWKGAVDPDYVCVAEKLWDWWMPETERVGVPEKPFDDLRDYVRTVASFRPVYVRRDGKPLVLKRYRTFAEFYASPRAVGEDPEGREVSFEPEEADIDLHSTCYWYNARLSRYYTVENRVNDQQPPEELMCVPAVTLGLISALPEAWEELSAYDWAALREARQAACRSGLRASVGGLSLETFARRMLDICALGLRRRNLGEERLLSPLSRRLDRRENPADHAARTVREGGIRALVEQRSL